MALTPIESDWLRLELTEAEEIASKLLSPELAQKLKHIQTELAEALAEFEFHVSPETGMQLNSPNYFLLRGRRSMVLDLLRDDREARGLLTAQDITPPESQSA
jgi:hypothetical protein